MFTDIDGIKTNYTDSGEGETVLFLHGWGVDITLYEQLLGHIRQSFRVVALDMPGFGATSEPEQPWCVDNYVDFIVSFCRKLDIEKAILFGHSFGGRVIIKLLSRKACPIEVKRVILTGSAGIKPKKSLGQRLRLRCYKIGKGFLSLPPVKKLFPSALDSLRKRNGSADYNSATPVMRQTLVKVVNEDLSALLPEVKQDVLLVWGENDDATPISDGRQMEREMPSAGLAAIKNAGHYSFLEQPFLFYSIIDSYLNSK